MTDSRVPQQHEPRLYRARPRGRGNGSGACMVCGKSAINDCAFFVPSRETGEAIVNLFREGANLDYRPSEPDWIQVKVHACDEHVSHLDDLISAVEASVERRDGPGISPEMVARYTRQPAKA